MCASAVTDADVTAEKCSLLGATVLSVEREGYCLLCILVVVADLISKGITQVKTRS